MPFYGLDFLFDGGHSSNYGLKISSINDNGTADVTAGCGVELFSDSIYRNPTVYGQGVSQNEVLSFEIEFMSEDELPGIIRSKINKWLFGHMNYHKLQIIQSDLANIYFNCHLIEPELIFIGNECHGIKCTAECDAPWAWQIAKTYSKTNLECDTVNYETWRFYNDSDDNDYTYPLLEFKMNDGDVGERGVCSIINESDNNREFRFEGLSPGEIITVDCRHQTLKSERIVNNGIRIPTGILRSENFNKKFFRLISSLNIIKLGGAINYVKLTYANARKVGG